MRGNSRQESFSDAVELKTVAVPEHRLRLVRVTSRRLRKVSAGGLGGVALGGCVGQLADVRPSRRAAATAAVV